MFFFLEQSGFIRNYRMGALSLQRLNNDQLLLLIYSIFCTKRDYITVTQL